MGVYYTLRSSSSITPNIRGNMSYSANFKTVQELAGQHDLDLGGEYFQTEHQFGRERNQNYGVFEGGWIHDYSKSNMDPSSYLFPVFYTSDGSPLITNPNGSLLQYWDNMRGPSAHVEQYFAGNGKALNNSTSLWVNDTWTMNERWNAMLGLRYNRFVVKDTNGKDRANNAIIEPRLQIKFNPDGKDREIYSFSAAKLASSYSDDMASWFRTNGWTSRVVRDWNGAAWNAANPGAYQYGVNDPLSASDPLAGVRWVGYNDLINLGNYGPPSMFVALDQTMQTSGLSVPYAIEFTLGYTRNYETGSVRIYAVDRTFHKDWIVLAPRGWYDPSNPTKYLTLVHDPSGLTSGPASMNWQQTQPFFNSELKRNYQDLEISWNQAINANLTFGGSYTYAVEHGPTNGGYDHYLYRDEKLKLGIPESVWAPSNALLNKSQSFKTWLTYLHHIGKGNVSASVMGSYSSATVRNFMGTSSLPVTSVDSSNAAFGGIGVTMPDYNVAQFPVPTYGRYYGGAGSFTSGMDVYSIDLRLQAQLPISGKLMVTSYVQVNNLFNRINRTNTYDWGSGGELGVNQDTNGNGPIDGRPLSVFNKPWGYSGDYRYYTAGRSYSEFAIGLKF
jgi:hypothetical protein